MLHLGNVYFHRKQLKHGQEGVEIGSDAEIRWTGHLLRLDVDGIREALTTKTTVRDRFFFFFTKSFRSFSLFTQRFVFVLLFFSLGSAQRTCTDGVEHRSSFGRQRRVRQSSVQFVVHVARGSHQSYRVQGYEKNDGHIDFRHIRF